MVQIREELSLHAGRLTQKDLSMGDTQPSGHREGGGGREGGSRGFTHIARTRHLNLQGQWTREPRTEHRIFEIRVTEGDPLQNSLRVFRHDREPSLPRFGIGVLHQDEAREGGGLRGSGTRFVVGETPQRGRDVRAMERRWELGSSGHDCSLRGLPLCQIGQRLSDRSDPKESQLV
jgi:hypothetical protein